MLEEDTVTQSADEVRSLEDPQKQLPCIGEAKRDGLRRDLTRETGAVVQLFRQRSSLLTWQTSPAGRTDDWTGKIGGRELGDNQEKSCRSFLSTNTPRPRPKQGYEGTGRLGPWNSSRRWPVPRSWPAAYWPAWERG